MISFIKHQVIIILYCFNHMGEKYYGSYPDLDKENRKIGMEQAVDDAFRHIESRVMAGFGYGYDERQRREKIKNKEFTVDFGEAPSSHGEVIKFPLETGKEEVRKMVSQLQSGKSIVIQMEGYSVQIRNEGEDGFRVVVHM